MEDTREIAIIIGPHISCLQKYFETGSGKVLGKSFYYMKM